MSSACGIFCDIAKRNTLLHSQESLMLALAEGVIPVSCDEAPVCLCARRLFRLKEKHGTAIYALSVVELVNDAEQINGNRDTSSPGKRASALQKAKLHQLA